MLRGDLSVAGLADVLRDLADRGSTGRLLIARNPAPPVGVARQVSVYLNRGQLYAAEIDDSGTDSEVGPDDRLATRLLVHGLVSLDALRDAREAQDELVDWSLGELLVQLGHLPAASFQDIAELELLDAVSTAAGWAGGNWRLRRGDRSRQLLTRSLDLAELLERVEGQLAGWAALESQGFGALHVPRLLDAGDEEPAALETDRAALLREVDGQTATFALAARCGITALEAASAVAELAAGGHLDRPEPELAPEESADPLLRVSASVRAAMTGDGTEPEPDLEPDVRMIPSDRPALPVEDLDPETTERRARLRAQAARELLDAQVEVTQLPGNAAWQWDAPADEPPLEFGAVELGEAELEAPAADVTEFGSSEFGSSEFGSSEFGSAEIGSTEIGSTEIEAAEIEIAAVEIAAVEIEASEAVESEPGLHPVELDASAPVDLVDQVDLVDAPADLPTEISMPEVSDPQDIGSPADDSVAEAPTQDAAGSEGATPEDPTDMASLLRELTSLGLEDDAPPPPRPVVPAQSVAPPQAQPRKRKGLLRRAQ